MAMPEPKFSTPQLTGTHMSSAQDDDIPQTFRRERDAREKEAREREAKARDARERETRARDAKAAQTFPSATDVPPRDYTLPDIRDMPKGVVVSALKIPFLRLMAFFIKAVFAAIPALLILIGILWGIGQIAQTYFPWLVKMRILIQFP
jgi:hypothetical protein